MNVDKHIANELTSIIKSNLPKFTQLKSVADSTWDKQGKFPYIFIFMPDEIDASYHYEDSSI